MRLGAIVVTDGLLASCSYDATAGTSALVEHRVMAPCPSCRCCGPHTGCHAPRGIEAVDLGMIVRRGSTTYRVLWASMNVGASRPEDYGDYFAWGETSAKDDFAWSTYSLLTEGGTADWTAIGRYTLSDGQTEGGWYDGVTFAGDGKERLDPADDAASALWGGDWRMPTHEEMEALSALPRTWTTRHGVAGYSIAGNGNTIFLPAAGCRSGAALNDAGSNGYYWSSQLGGAFTDLAWFTSFYSGYFNPYGCSDRCLGRSIRPVRLVPMR